MKAILISTFLLITFLISEWAQSDIVLVTRIIDGDTYIVQDGVESITIRLANVDAPERAQEYGLESRLKVSNLILGKEVELTKLSNDKYGRTIGMIYIENMRLDSIIVRNGWGWHYARYNDEAMLKTCQNEAQKCKLGLWSGDNIINPEEYRHKK